MISVDNFNDDDPCPNCEHPMTSHSLDLGCHVGWFRLVPKDGCLCPFTFAHQCNPKRESDFPG